MLTRYHQPMYLRLIGLQNQHWNSRGHFFGAAAEAMRRILIGKARRKGGLKVWDLQSDLKLLSFDDGVYGMTFSRDGNLLIYNNFKRLTTYDATLVPEKP